MAAPAPWSPVPTWELAATPLGSCPKPQGHPAPPTNGALGRLGAALSLRRRQPASPGRGPGLRAAAVGGHCGRMALQSRDRVSHHLHTGPGAAGVSGPPGMQCGLLQPQAGPGCSNSARQSPVLREAGEDLLSPEAGLPSGASDVHAGTRLPRGRCEQGFECGPVTVPWSLAGARVRPPSRPPLPRAPRRSPPTRQTPGAGSPTWGAKAESTGRAEAAAAHPGCQGCIVLAGAGLVLAGRGHQADAATSTPPSG